MLLNGFKSFRNFCLKSKPQFGLHVAEKHVRTHENAHILVNVCLIKIKLFQFKEFDPMVDA